MTLTTKTPDELQTLLATARESQAAIEAEMTRREEEEAEKARKRVRPLKIANNGEDLVLGPDNGKRWLYGRIYSEGMTERGLDIAREARVHAYAECMAKAAESVASSESYKEAGYDSIDAIMWCADMIAERESTPYRTEAARAAGFID